MKNLMIAFLSMGFMVILSQPIHAQLSESQKKERCESGKKHLAELKRDLASLKDEIIRLPERAQIEDEKFDLEMVRRYTKLVKDTIKLGLAMRNEKDYNKRMIMREEISYRYHKYIESLSDDYPDSEEEPDIRLIAAKYNSTICYTDINCLDNLSNIVAKKIARDETKIKTNPEIMDIIKDIESATEVTTIQTEPDTDNRKADLEKQIQLQINSLAALKCDEQSSVPTSNNSSGSTSKRACNFTEADAFNLMTGSWKNSVLKLTIKGSCEAAGGEMEWVEWCSPLEDKISNYPHYPGTFEGAMDGETLVLAWTIPAKGPHKEQKGTAYVHPKTGGGIRVSGFACGDGTLNK